MGAGGAGRNNTANILAELKFIRFLRKDKTNISGDGCGTVKHWQNTVGRCGGEASSEWYSESPDAGTSHIGEFPQHMSETMLQVNVCLSEGEQSRQGLLDPVLSPFLRRFDYSDLLLLIR